MGIEEIDRIIEGTVDEENVINISKLENIMSDVNLEFLDDFIVETKEHVENIEAAALNLENSTLRAEEINSLFRAFHTIKGLAGFVDQQLIQNLAHETETLLDCCRKDKISITKNIVDVILTSADFIKRICYDLTLNNDSNFRELIFAHKLILAEINNSGTFENGNVAVQISTPNIEQEHIFKPIDDAEVPISTKEKFSAEDSVIRIHVQKIDNLVDMVGELIINQSLVDQKCVENFGNNEVFCDQVHRVSRIIKDLQNLSLSMRMVSLRSTFQKLRRIARTTISETCKNVDIQFIGEETEIDRSVADTLLDPLIHIIKNSISHGIEHESERIKMGKPATGTITVDAFSKKGNVYITITDDGAGICTDVICKKAVEKGLAKPDSEYTKEEIRNFVFSPGFSTAQKVDNISGRGVGMDVVRTEISKIGGKAELFSVGDLSKKFISGKVCPCVEDECNCHKGKGLKVSLRIPINMAIMNGTIVDVKGTKYILPTLQVKKIFKPEPEQWVSLKGSRNMIKMRDEIVSVIPVNDVFELQDFSLDDCIVVVLEHEQQLRALPVSDIIDKREIVVKSLGEVFAGLQYAAGASILGDGKVAVILDVEYLFKKEEGK